MTVLSGFAIIMLPRQFYVMIVENRSETELRTATWVFPLYLVAINLFVLPIAFAGLVAGRRGDQQRPLRAVAAAARAATTCWRWSPSSAACRRRPPWSSSRASRCRS